MYRLPFDNDQQPRPIYTRSGWEIPQEFVLPSSPEKVQIRGSEILRFRQNLQLGTVSNYPYNCVGLVFTSRRAWINPEHLPRLLHEDGYIHIQRQESKIGDIVVYRDNRNDVSHVGIIVSVHIIGNSRALTVLSKWGHDPEFIHDENNVIPLLGRPVEYWTLGHD